MSDTEPRKAMTGPVRSTHSAKSNKPYARPIKAQGGRDEREGSLLGGLKNVFKSLFAGSSATAQEGDPDRTTSHVGSDESSDEEEEEKGSKRALPSPDAVDRHSKRLRRTSPSPPAKRLPTSHSLGYGHSLSGVASGGIKRSGTLLSLDTRKSRPADTRTRKPIPEHWSPWNEPSERHQPTTTTGRGFSRSGSVGYGLQASPLRQPPRAGLFASQAQAQRPRSVLHPLASASLVRSPSLPSRGMREQRRETTALLPSSPAAPRSGLRYEVERSPSVQVGRGESVLSGMSGLVVREPQWRKEHPSIETTHKTEAERILATLSSLRTSHPTQSSASYSSRTLRKQIAVPAPSGDASRMHLLPGESLGALRRAREVDGAVVVSPYAKRRVRESSERVEETREDSEEVDGGDRGSRTPMRESTGKPSPSPAPQELPRPDPTSFPSPPAQKPLPKPLPIAFSPSAKNLPSAATAARSKATASSLRARTTMTTRKHTAAAGSRHGGRFSALDDDDEAAEGDGEGGYNLDLEELERAAEKRSEAPRIQGPMVDLFAPKVTPTPAETVAAENTTRNEQHPVKQAPGFLNVKMDHKPRSSSPLKAMVVPSPESNKASSSTGGSQQGEETPAPPAFSFAKPASDAPKPSFSLTTSTAEKPSFSFGLGKPSSAPSSAPSSFSFATPAKPTENQQNSTTPAEPVPSTATSFSFNPAEKTEPSKAPAFSFGAPSGASGPPSFFSQPAAADKAPPAEPKGVAPPKAGLFSFSTAPPTAAPVIPPAVASSLPAGNPFAAVSAPSASANSTTDKPADASASKSLFSFGNTPTSAPVEAKPAAPTSTPTSLFGAPAQASPAPAAAPSFSFGSPAPAASVPSTTPSFSFGKPAEAPKPVTSSPFSFGASAPAPSPAANPPSFSFGATTAPAASSPAPAPASLPTFGGFGTSTASPSPAPAATTFNFGSSSSGFGAPAPASAGFGSAPATNMFGSNTASIPTPTAPVFGGFGNAIQSPQPSAAAPSFSFGAPSAAPSTASFAFGSTPVATPAAPTFGGFSAPSPAFGAREATATPPPMFNMGADNAPGSPGAAGRKIRGIPKRGKKP